MILAPAWSLRRYIAAAASLLLGLNPISLRAEPFLPTDDAQVIERLPTPTGGTKRELRDLRDALARNPNDLPSAINLARRYVQIGRAEADPRYYGHAEALLQPWWRLEAPPTDVLLLRATLRQNRHEFAASLDDLSAVLAADPRNAQAWLTQAVILQVVGRHDEAERSCANLVLLTARLVSTACLADVASVSGRAAEAYALLRGTLDATPDTDMELREWALGILAEIAARAEDPVAAEQHFRAALALGIKDVYLLGAYADFLLDQGRPAEVRDLLAGETRIDPLLLRLALAEERLAAPELAEHVAALEARFATARLRGDSVHRREEARFTLHLLQQPAEAFRLARENWQMQREAWDARLVLESALAAGNKAQAADVVAWVKESGLEDKEIRTLVAKLSELTP